MNDVLIRKATADDLDELLQFEQGIIQAERPFDPTLNDDPISYYDIQKMLRDPLFDVVVAEADGHIVASGYARVEAAKPYLRHSQQAYFGMMYVRPAYRGCGLNARVLDELKRLAIERGITEARLDVYVGNEAAIKAYEKFGFTGHLLEMRMALK